MQSQRKAAGLLCNYAKLPEVDPGEALSAALGGRAVTQGHSQQDTECRTQGMQT